MSTLAILLCTCNSERYLQEQIDSLTGQTYQDWHLYIRDDNSSDNTLNIISKYTQADPRINFLQDSRKRGARDGFMWLLQQVEADYYMFCDHDDVWLPEKIETTLQLMTSQPDKDTRPIIACCNLKLVDAQLNSIADDYWTCQHYNDHQFNDKNFHLFYNNMPGCVMMLNKKAKEVSLPYPADAIMHDWWVAAAVLWRGGRAIWTLKPLMLYRQHGHNTIGAGDRTLLQQLGILPELINKTKTQHHACKSLTSMSFLLFFLLKLKYLLKYHWAAVSSRH